VLKNVTPFQIDHLNGRKHGGPSEEKPCLTCAVKFGGFWDTLYSYDWKRHLWHGYGQILSIIKKVLTFVHSRL